MNIKTKLYVTKNIWKSFNCDKNSKIVLTLNKPTYVVMCVLDLSKVLMYEFHDDYTESKHCNKSRLLFDDTDILKYQIKASHLEYIGPR